MDRLLTFETWVSRKAWFDYAQAHPDQVPHLLTDRSPCQDPFFDPFAPAPGARRPLIAGLCRKLRRFVPGQRFLYITRIDPALVGRPGLLGLSELSGLAGPGPHYLAVAALEVAQVFPDHASAARTYEARPYISTPAPTLFPPNLAHLPEALAAACRTASVIYARDAATGRVRTLTGDTATHDQWLRQYAVYHRRSVGEGRPLGAAECRVLRRTDGRERLYLNPGEAPVLTPAAWGGARMNVMGLPLPEAAASKLIQQFF